MASGTDGSRSSDSEIRTLSSALGPFLLCLFHSYLDLLHTVVHSRYNPISRHIIVEREHFFPSLSSKHPRTDFHWASLGHLAHLSQSPGPGMSCAGVLADLSHLLIPRAWGWGSVPSTSQKAGEGKFPQENLECSFQKKEEELLGWLNYKHQLQSFGEFGPGHTRSPASQFLAHCAQLPQLLLLPRNSLLRNHKM